VGAITASLYRMKKGLLLGLDGSGKTLLLRHLSLQCSLLKQQHTASSTAKFSSFINSRYFSSGKLGTENVLNIYTTPTTGVEEEVLVYDKSSYTIQEIGAPMLPMWKAYFGLANFFLVLGCYETTSWILTDLISQFVVCD